MHVANKACDPKGRHCIDATHSGLNSGTYIDALTLWLGKYTLLTLQTLAKMLHVAELAGNTALHKTDVTKAFNCMRLHPATAMLQIYQHGDLAIIPLVAGFGWCAAPAYYNVIAGAIDWAHNGGISRNLLD